MTDAAHIYTPAEIRELLADGYITVHRTLWDHIPHGSHVRYMLKPPRDSRDWGISEGARFRPGGYVKNHYTSESGIEMLLIETRPGGKKGDPSYLSIPIDKAEIEVLWKKYPRDAFVEIHMMAASLAQKKMEIEKLEIRVTALELALARK